MNLLYHYTGQLALQCTLLLVAVATLITSAENLYYYRIYSVGGFLDWGHLRPCRRIYGTYPAIGRTADLLFRYPAVLGLLFLRAVLSAAVIVAALHGPVPAPLLLALGVTGLLVYLRNQFSNNGSDQLSNIILVAASIAYIPVPNSLVLSLSVFFIGCQSILSYLTSGWLKMLNADWRNGVCLKDIFHTATFGHPWITRLLGDRMGVYRLLSLSVILLEIFLGCCIVLPPPVCAGLLVCGVLLHGSIAFIMGLNNFLWTFPATYPCVFFICLKVHHLITS